jgi:hypothetical protein
MSSILTKPDTSTDITRAGIVIGQVKCININPPSQPPAIRWFGQRPGEHAPSGHARTTQAQAAQDVADWADGKDVPYEQHAVVEKAGMFTASACSSQPSTTPIISYIIGLPQEDAACDLCGNVEELRPYGPNGENICFDCGMLDEETTKRMFLQRISPGTLQPGQDN